MKIDGFSRGWVAVSRVSAMALLLSPGCLPAQTVPPRRTPQAAAPAPQMASPAVTFPPQPLNMLEEPAKEAKVTFSGDSLTIHADNSSLAAILNEVSHLSGMQISGLAGDERVFGSFGPAAPSEVLADLLNGTAYDMVMVGNAAHGAPRELILTPAKAGGSSHPATSALMSHPAAEETAPEEEPPPPQPEPVQTPQTPGPPVPGGTRTPQQLFQQLQQMRQQQQQQIPPQQDQQQQTTPQQ